jgi:hypothetical protein
MAVISTISKEWYTRKPDERFLNLHELLAAVEDYEAPVSNLVYSSQDVDVVEREGRLCIDMVRGAQRSPSVPNHWAMSQLCARTETPAEYMRRLPVALAAECLNHGLKRRSRELALRVRAPSDQPALLLAANGPQFQAGSDSDVVRLLTQRVGDGVSGDWRVPGESGKAVTVTRNNTTLYYGETGLCVYLADEKNRITIPNRRAGMYGDFARGFIIRNSCVGASYFTIETFLFDYTCYNRNIWGVSNHNTVKIRHSGDAPERIMYEAWPAIKALSNESPKPMQDLLLAAAAKKVTMEKIVGWYGPKEADMLTAVSMVEERKPIETLFDLSASWSARAKKSRFMDDRMKMEREAGKVLELAA